MKLLKKKEEEEKQLYKLKVLIFKILNDSYMLQSYSSSPTKNTSQYFSLF